MNQSLPLSEQLKALENLQEIDLKIDSLKKNKASLPATLKSLDDNLVQLKMTTELKQKALATLDKNHKQTQAAQDINRDRQARASTKLEGVQNTHEFQAANKEIEQLKKLNGTLEEQSQKAVADMNVLTQEIAELNSRMEKLSAERQEQAAQVGTQVGQLDQDIAALMGDRTQYTSRVESRIFSQYERVRAARAGLGIVPAIGGRCKGCNMMVPPQQFIEIQKGTQLHQCPSCHRILFVAASGAPAVTGQKA